MERLFAQLSFSLLLFSIPVLSIAQQPDTLKERQLRYFNSFNAGALLSGSDKGFTGSLSTVHGVCIRKFRIGLGIGLEGYDNWRVMPFFGSVSFDFATVRKNAFYVQLNTGHALGWRRQGVQWATEVDERGGWMFNPMIGYRIRDNKYSFFIAAGHRLQRTTYAYTFSLWDNWHRYTLDEEMNRFFIQLGFGLN